jgi:5'-nucleotidase (lipoprotein e(P4) family)
MIFQGMNPRSVISLALFVVAAAACSPARSATPAPAAAPTAAPVASDSLPNDVKWVRTSAEYRALTRQAYALAGDKLPDLAKGLPAHTWGVILDADETVLNNSEHQRRLAVSHAPYDPKAWSAWVSERAATAIAGATDFAKLVHSLGGRVVVVTNRSMADCDPTKENLRSVGFDADLVLCMPPGEGNKNVRFERVQSGTASPGLPALTVVEWVGDNIQDFPKLTQAARTDSTALAQFGRKYFIIPNPMYGSWERVH